MQMQNRFMRPVGQGFGMLMRPPNQQQMQMQGGQPIRQMNPQQPGMGQQPRQMMASQGGQPGPMGQMQMMGGMGAGRHMSPGHPGMSPSHSVSYGSPAPAPPSGGPMRRPSGSN